MFIHKKPWWMNKHCTTLLTAALSDILTMGFSDHWWPCPQKQTGPICDVLGPQDAFLDRASDPWPSSPRTPPDPCPPAIVCPAKFKTRTQRWKKGDATTSELHLSRREEPVANMGVCILTLLLSHTVLSRRSRGGHTLLFISDSYPITTSPRTWHNTLTCHSNHTHLNLTILECVCFQLPEFLFSMQSHFSLKEPTNGFLVQM